MILENSPKIVEDAEKFLKTKKNYYEIDRELLVAYSTLYAWAKHWPSSATTIQKNLIKQFSEIAKVEKSRCLKQSRVAVAKIKSSIGAS